MRYMNHVIQALDDQPLVQFGKYKFVINPLTEQIPATTAELLQSATNWLLAEGNFKQATKIVGEEDKGGILVASTSLATGLPFGMARWYPSGLEGQVAIVFDMEYTRGNLYLNGVNEEDRVIIVDDMISTGGTMLALVEAIQSAGATIVDIICVAEKVDYGGVEKVAEKTGYRVKSLLKISTTGEKSEVIQTL